MINDEYTRKELKVYSDNIQQLMNTYFLFPNTRDNERNLLFPETNLILKYAICKDWKLEYHQTSKKETLEVRSEYRNDLKRKIPK